MNTTFNRALGAAVELARLYPSAWVMILLQVAEADDALRDHADVAALLAAAGNTEIANVGYARKTGMAVTITTDNATNKARLAVPQQVFSGITAGGSVTKVIIGVATGSGDAATVPIAAHDVSISIDGNPITIKSPNGYFYEAI